MGWNRREVMAENMDGGAQDECGLPCPLRSPPPSPLSRFSSPSASQLWWLTGGGAGSGQVCIIGAGKMSKLLVKHLVSKGCERMTILNRSLPRAEDLAAEFSEVSLSLSVPFFWTFPCP